MFSESYENRYGTPWSREELILAFELYCRIPFQKTKTNNPAVQKLAKLLGRSPASVARKLGNFGSFDPELQKAKISGLIHVSKLDRQIWDEFHENWGELVWEANKLRHEFMEQTADQVFLDRPSGASETLRMTKQRIHQSFFRETILSSYNETCCITGLQVRECLIASHIVPWSTSEKYRTDPTNGLCLSATFDRLFDSGFITVSESLTVCVSETLLQIRNPVVKNLIDIYHGKPIIRPQRFLPSMEKLHWHRTNVFRK
jgi:putative restriction endonuclease